MTTAPTRQLLPDLDALKAVSKTSGYDYGLVIDSAIKLLYSRLPRREEHLDALIILGRALLRRNVDNDNQTALERLDEALDLAVVIGPSDLIKNAGEALATAYALARRYAEADGTIARLAVLLLRGNRPNQEHVKWLERLTHQISAIAGRPL